MKVVCWTEIVSPHQIPLAKEIVKRVGEANYCYIFSDEFSSRRIEMGWGGDEPPAWCRQGEESDPALIDADLLYFGGLHGYRPTELIERRIAARKMTYYMTERWFKPYGVIPGRWRLWTPGYRRMAKNMMNLLNNPFCKVLAIGPWAKKDMLQIGVKESQIEDWGYFVEPSITNHKPLTTNHTLLRVLWVGRMIGWKRVDTIIKAVKAIAKSEEMRFDVELTLVGEGSKRNTLEGMASALPVMFKDPMPIGKVRDVMRDHDVYVLASDENEGWGAAVNEALEEGMKVLGTYEAGASAAMLPEEDLFHAGDWKTLSEKLVKCGVDKRNGVLKGQGIGKWTPQWAAERLLGSF